MQGTFAATPPLESLRYTGFKLADDDMVGNFTSSCLCLTYIEHISIRQLCVDCTPLCWRKTQHLAWSDNFFERSMGRGTRLLDGTISRTRKLLQSGIKLD